MQNGFMFTPYVSAIPEIPGLGTLHIRKAAEPMDWEEHGDAFELLYLKSGEKKLTVDDREYDLFGNDLLVIHPGEVHGNYRAVQNRSFLYYLLIADPMRCPSFLHLDEEGRAFLAQGLRNIHQVHLTQETRDIYLQLFECVQGTGHLAKERAAALCLLLLYDLCSGAEEVKREISPDIQRAVDYVNQHETDMPQVGELAAIAGLSEPHFKQKFKRYLGLPPAEYLARVHVDKAEKRLAETRQSIASIAAGLGFSSSQHFSKLFRRYRGVSPSEYRRRLREGDAPETVQESNEGGDLYENRYPGGLAESGQPGRQSAQSSGDGRGRRSAVRCGR